MRQTFGLGLAVALALAVTPAVAQNKKAPVAEKAPSGPKLETVQVDFGVPVGSIVIINSERRLYYVTAKGEARRYPVAVGKQEELWMGRSFVSARVVDPKWIPVDGSDPIEGGDPANPLGKRALYLDWSLLRIHGTPSRGSIGSAVSNGCIRMLDEHVLDLFERVHMGAPVIAARTREEVQTYKTTKIAQKFYADPEARKAAKEDQAQFEPASSRARSAQRAAPVRTVAAPIRPILVASGAPRTPAPWALGFRPRY
jgi:lipoprotein-anchoring transpeptidase ErfK/SrfK